MSTLDFEIFEMIAAHGHCITKKVSDCSMFVKRNFCVPVTLFEDGTIIVPKAWAELVNKNLFFLDPNELTSKTEDVLSPWIETPSGFATLSMQFFNVYTAPDEKKPGLYFDIYGYDVIGTIDFQRTIDQLVYWDGKNWYHQIFPHADSESPGDEVECGGLYFKRNKDLKILDYIPIKH